MVLCEGGISLIRKQDVSNFLTAGIFKVKCWCAAESLEAKLTISNAGAALWLNVL